MRSIGWTATSMPIVFWSMSIEDFNVNPLMPEQMEEAEVRLPNGFLVLVEKIHYLGLSAGQHHWQGIFKGVIS